MVYNHVWIGSQNCSSRVVSTCKQLYWSRSATFDFHTRPRSFTAQVRLRLLLGFIFYLIQTRFRFGWPPGVTVAGRTLCTLRWHVIKLQSNACIFVKAARIFVYLNRFLDLSGLALFISGLVLWRTEGNNALIALFVLGMLVFIPGMSKLYRTTHLALLFCQDFRKAKKCTWIPH